MINQKAAQDRIVSPIVNERIQKTIEFLGEKVDGAAHISCTVRHVAKDIFEVAISVEPKGENQRELFARKSGKSIFVAVAEAQRAVQSQFFTRKGKFHRRRHDDNAQSDSTFPLTG